MNIEYLANLAEIISSIAMVVTLIFLVLQIRDNTKAMRSTAIDNFYNAYLDITADANRVPEVAMALHKAFADQPMDDRERGHFVTYIQRTCSTLERMLILRGDAKVTEAFLESMMPPAKMVFATPAARYWYYFLKDERQLFRPELHTFMDDFYRHLDAGLAHQSRPEAKAAEPLAQAGDGVVSVI